MSACDSSIQFTPAETKLEYLKQYPAEAIQNALRLGAVVGESHTPEMAGGLDHRFAAASR